MYHLKSEECMEINNYKGGQVTSTAVSSSEQTSAEETKNIDSVKVESDTVTISPEAQALQHSFSSDSDLLPGPGGDDQPPRKKG